MNREEITNVLKGVFVDHCLLEDGTYPDNIDDIDESMKMNELGIDSLDAVEIIIELERMFGINITDEYFYDNYDMTFKEAADKFYDIIMKSNVKSYFIFDKGSSTLTKKYNF